MHTPSDVHKGTKPPLEKPAPHGFVPCSISHASHAQSPLSPRKFSDQKFDSFLQFWLFILEDKKHDPQNSLLIQLMDAKTVVGNNDIDDVRWLCSLTESELDLLMGLKNMVKMRAKKIGHEALAKKFDLRMLRALSFIFMEHLKGQLKDAPVTLDFDCNLLKQNLSGCFACMTIEDLYPYICSDQRKRITDMFFQDTPPSQKQKTSK